MWRTLSGDNVECGVLAWSAADGPEANLGMENWSGGRYGDSSKSGLQSADECKVSGVIIHGDFLRKSLPVAHGKGVSVSSKGDDR